MSKKLLLLAGVAFLGGFLFAEFGGRDLAHAQESKDPKWSHGMTLRVRKFDEPDFGPNTKKVGIEVFVDQTNGNLIYITEAGGISVVKK